MRIKSIFATILAMASPSANASDVRRSDLPTSVWGTWAPNSDACGGTDKSKINISAKKHSSENLACEIEWVTVTATPKGPNYSTRSRCIDQTTKKQNPPTFFLVRPIDSNQIRVGLTEAGLKTYQRCQ
jgi:hypothetical protein